MARKKKYRRATSRSKTVSVVRTESGELVGVRDLTGPSKHRLKNPDVVSLPHASSGGGYLNMAESPIVRFVQSDRIGRGAVRLRRLIAVDWLVHNFERSGLTPRVSARYQVAGSGGTPHMSMAQALAFEAMLLIHYAVPDHARLLEAVVCWNVDFSDDALLNQGLDALHAKLSRIEEQLKEQKKGIATRPGSRNEHVPAWVDYAQKSHSDVD